MKKGIISIAGVLIVVLIFLFIQKQKQEPLTNDSLTESSSVSVPAENTKPTSNQSNNQIMQEQNSEQPAVDPSLEGVTQATFKTNRGDFTLELYREESPITVNNFIALASEGFYDGVKFHRVIDGFMIQAGDPQSKDDLAKSMWGTGGPGYTIEDEFIEGLSNIRGTIAMANTGRPNSGGSQFFINLVDNTNLDFNKQPLTSKHPVFGKVIEGMEVVDAIGGTAVDGSDRPLDDVVINSIELK